MVWATDDQLIIADFILNSLSSEVFDFTDDELAQINQIAVKYSINNDDKKI